MCGRSCGQPVSCIHPNECARSRARVRAGQVFYASDDHSNFRIIEADHAHATRNSSAQSITTTPESPRPLDLSAHVGPRPDDKFPVCTLCHLDCPGCVRMEFTGGRAAWGSSPVVKMYVVGKCGHAFHEACLYSFLVEGNDMDFSRCEECKALREFVARSGCGVAAVEEAIERVEASRWGE